MATYPDAFSGRSTCTLTLTVTEVTPTSTNIANNQSVVSFSLVVTGNNASFNNGAGTWSISINGTPYSGTWSYNFTTANTVTLKSTTTQTISHNTNGSKSISVSATATDSGGSPLGTASSSGTLALTDFVRVPTTPAQPTLTRTGSSITATTTGSTFYGTTPTYEWQQRTEPNSFAVISGATGTSVTFDCGSTTDTAYVQVRAHDSEGYSSTAMQSIYGVPGVPGTIATFRTGHDVLVTCGISSGTAITNYWVSYSTDNGSTWSSAVAMTSYQYNFTNLTPGATYVFRVRAENSIGFSGYATSAGEFIPAGGKRWTGSAWQSNATAKRWDGTGWVDISTARRWDGSSWVDLT